MTFKRNIKEEVLKAVFTKEYLEDLDGTYELKFCLHDLHKVMDKLLSKDRKKVEDIINKKLDFLQKTLKLYPTQSSQWWRISHQIIIVEELKKELL